MDTTPQESDSVEMPEMPPVTQLDLFLERIFQKYVYVPGAELRNNQKMSEQVTRLVC